MSDGQTLRKSDFAALCGVTPGCVSQWIADGKIGPDALVGEGRSARIISQIAISHLRERLDSARSPRAKHVGAANFHITLEVSIENGRLAGAHVFSVEQLEKF